MPRKKKIDGTPTVEAPKRVRKIKKLQEEKSEYDRVKDLLESKTWMTVVQPLLDKMIIDTIGGLGTDGFWKPGIVGSANCKGYSTDYLLGYRMSLIDFNNRLKEKQFLSKKVDEQIKDLKTKEPITTTSWSYMPQTGGTK